MPTAYSINDLTRSYIADADLSARQYCGVDKTATGVNVPSAGGRIVGVLGNKPKLGETAEVMVQGVAQMVASAAIAEGANVAVTATGQAVTAATGNVIVGVAEKAASGAGANFPVLLCVAPGSKA